MTSFVLNGPGIHGGLYWQEATSDLGLRFFRFNHSINSEVFFVTSLSFRLPENLRAAILLAGTSLSRIFWSFGRGKVSNVACGR
jgi:hypothetical protein